MGSSPKRCKAGARIVPRTRLSWEIFAFEITCIYDGTRPRPLKVAMSLCTMHRALCKQHFQMNKEVPCAHTLMTDSAECML